MKFKASVGKIPNGRDIQLDVLIDDSRRALLVLYLVFVYDHHLAKVLRVYVRLYLVAHVCRFQSRRDVIRVEIWVTFKVFDAEKENGGKKCLSKSDISPHYAFCFIPRLDCLSS